MLRWDTNPFGMKWKGTAENLFEDREKNEKHRLACFEILEELECEDEE